MGDWKTELTGRVLLLVAHPDDESLAYGALLQKMRQPVVAIATDGAPRDEYFWGRHGSRQAYAALRRQEARRAMQLAGVRELALLAEDDARLEDQRLFLNLAAAYAPLQKLAERLRPQAIATLAYEGGHPDHDSCSLLGARLGARLGVPVWEAPLYHRAIDAGDTVAEAAPSAATGELRLQQFLSANGTEALVEISPQELERKRAMCAQYASQGPLLRSADRQSAIDSNVAAGSMLADARGRDLQDFDPGCELLRPQVPYDYTRPPHAGPTNYECWQWWMSAAQVCASFVEFLESQP